MNISELDLDTPSLGVVQEAIRKLTKDEKAAAKIIHRNEARFLVDAYYAMQDNRIRADGQVRSMSKDGDPHAVLKWLADMNRTLEDQVKVALDTYSTSSRPGEWLRAQKGIGPVIAAGLLAHLDITKAQTAGAFWSFAGLDPRAEWKTGEKRPWNASLKTLCWKLGESFVKVSGADDAFYGRIYKERKTLEITNNEAGLYAEQAKAKLDKFKIGKDTDAYAAYIQGKLPPAHLHARAKRYAVKLLLAHLHEVMFKDHYGTEPPLPYAIAHLNHAHKIEPPQG
jgi:hypothetical protein